MNDTAAERAQTAAMFFPSTKEHTMKRFLAVLFAAMLVTLVVTAVASAHRSTRGTQPTVRVALHHHHLIL